VENSMEVPQKIKIELRSNNHAPVIYSKKIKSVYQKDTCTVIFIEALFTITNMDLT
jgi:hypothetical protein